MKTLLILCHGMRPDSIENSPLPCHMSLFHSVDPGRHGITTNIYMPQVRPVMGLCEVLNQSGKKCAVNLFQAVFMGMKNQARFSANWQKPPSRGKIQILPFSIWAYWMRPGINTDGAAMNIIRGKMITGVSIKDIAPTIADLHDAIIPEEWEGKIIR